VHGDHTGNLPEYVLEDAFYEYVLEDAFYLNYKGA
jgi:hypothetical protein